MHLADEYRKIVYQSIKHLWSALWEIRASLYFSSKDLVNAIEGSEGYKNLFFIIGTGRSGTQFLANLLNNSPSVQAYHEPNRFEDRYVMAKSRINPEFNFNYINKFRKQAIYRRIAQNLNLIYGEISGTLRYHTYSLKKIFPHAKYFILVRDGRDVVRSIMRFNFYQNPFISAKNIKPENGSGLRENWDALSRFEKVCWLWSDSYKILIDENINKLNILKFEKIISDYDYIKAKLLVPAGININENDWSAVRNKKSPNATVAHNFPHWSEWSKEENEIFNRHCFRIMELFGYY